MAHFNSQGDEGPLGPPGPAGLEVRIGIAGFRYCFKGCANYS